MSKVAVLVDLGFFLPRYRSLIECKASPQHTAEVVATAVFQTAERHVAREHGEQLYRIFVYDCKPLAKKAHNPVTGKCIDFSRTAMFRFRNELHRELVCMRKVALRLGELAEDSQWTIRPDPLKRLLKKEIGVEDLTEDDLRYDATQKGVDIKFGLDIASLAYKRLVERIVLITGDSDFVPAAKLARREGLDVVLDPLWNHIAHSLHEHIDGLKSFWVKRDGRDQHEISKRGQSRPQAARNRPRRPRDRENGQWKRADRQGD
ncbi:NYN domain-containing protein [Steroidobacter flavus]|uniref:NYN domain-containing protein n=1 Tax=Steroidobacter flavus TaxID=1842136 RepID=A0ABV8SRC5_9GAMM